MDSRLMRLYVATFLYTLSMALALPLVPQFLDVGFHASLTVIGIVGGVYGAMQILLRLPMGDMADRRGRRRSLILSFALGAVAGLLYAFARDPWWLLAGHGLLGFASGIFWVAANSYLFDLVDESEIPRATSDYGVAIGLSMLVGPPLGGWLADAFGFASALATVAVASALGLALILTLPELPTGGAPPPGGLYARAWRIFKHPDIRASAIGTFLFSLIFSALSTFLPVYLLAVGFTSFAVGLLFALRQGASTIARYGLPEIMRRIGPRRVMGLGLALGAVGTAVIPFLAAPIALGIASAFAGFGTGVMVPANLTLVSRGAPKAERGLANGIYGTALGLGSAVAPFAFGFLAERFGIGFAFWGAAACGVAGVAVLALLPEPASSGGPAQAVEAAP